MTAAIPQPPTERLPSDNNRHRNEIRLALTNAVKLGASMVFTWAIALIGRLYIPRYLGPDRFGMLNFADAFSATAFVAMGLGVDTYVRKEVAVRPERASDFVGGVIALRLLLLPLIYLGMEITLRATHCREETKLLVYIAGITQFFMVGNGTSAGLLQAVGKVDEVSVLSVVIKAAWLLFVFIVIFTRLGLWAFALNLAVLEAAKSFVLFRLARKHVKFEIRINPKATWVAILASVPFLIAAVAPTIYGNFGVNLLSFWTSDREVGWYGAASGLAGMTLMLTPLVGWVLVPLLARTAAESEDAFYSIVRRALEFTLALALPISLMLLLGADLWISVLFGPAYLPAAMALRIQAISTVLMYLSIVGYYALAILNYTWRMSLVFVGGLIVNPICNYLLIPYLSARGGPGSGGVACTVSTLITELGMAVAIVALMGRRCYDRQLLLALVKSSGAALVVVWLDSMLKPIGALRLILDAILYAVLVVVTGAIDLRLMVALSGKALERWRARRSTRATDVAL